MPREGKAVRHNGMDAAIGAAANTRTREGRPFPWPAQLALGAGVGALAVGCALATRWVRRSDLHASLTTSGLALVRTVQGEDGASVRVLQHGGMFQSATYLDERHFYPPFAYLRAFERAFEAETPSFRIRRALMLGGGGYAWPKWTLLRHPELRLDVVELDPAITRIARRFFFLDELMERVGFERWRLEAAGCARLLEHSPEGGPRLGLFEGDARDFLDELADSSRTARYDLVVNDTFTGAEPARALATVEAARAAKFSLTPGGLYVANVVSRNEGADVSYLRAVVATLQEVFAHVLVIPCADEDFGGEDNYLVLATDRDLGREGRTSLTADAVPYGTDFPTAPLLDQ